MMATKIDWAEESWNPVTGCTPISPGCANCYAKRMARRLRAMGQRNYQRGFKPSIHSHAVDIPRKWKKPRRIFVCSMGDLFHDVIPSEFVRSVVCTATVCIQHTFLFLTKRPENLWTKLNYNGAQMVFMDNMWVGTSCENQEWADKRIPELLKIPAAVRWLSLEPLLGQIDISLWLGSDNVSAPYERDEGVGWVVVGCESGPKRRPCKLEWVKFIVDQCKSAGVPVFVKQLEINGKVEHDIAKFPKELQYREYSKGGGG